jgi:2-oxoglutarate ferredoxin oxidoreductase subunit beta
VARSHATQFNHMIEMLTRAAQHDEFCVVEILPECIEFYEGAFDAAVPRNGGVFQTIGLKKRWQAGGCGPARCDGRAGGDETGARTSPGRFGISHGTTVRPTKNAQEKKLIANTREKTNHADNFALLQKTFARMR